MEDPESNRLEAAPKNRAQAWFRVLLWLMPAVFGAVALFGLGWLGEKVGHGPAVLAVWWVITPAFVLATGWYQAHFSVRVRTGQDKASDLMLEFFMIQLLLTPLLWGLFLLVSLVCGWITFR